VEKFLRDNGFVKIWGSEAFFHPVHWVCFAKKECGWTVSGFGSESMRSVEHWRNAVTSAKMSGDIVE